VERQKDRREFRSNGLPGSDDSWRRSSGANSIEISGQLQSTSSQLTTEVKRQSCNGVRPVQSYPRSDTRDGNSATNFAFLIYLSHYRGTEFEPCSDHIASLAQSDLTETKHDSLRPFIHRSISHSWALAWKSLFILAAPMFMGGNTVITPLPPLKHRHPELLKTAKLFPFQELTASNDTRWPAQNKRHYLFMVPSHTLLVVCPTSQWDAKDVAVVEV
jgi:hypothetical protein